jgi:hypothetical protein
MDDQNGSESLPVEKDPLAHKIEPVKPVKPP